MIKVSICCITYNHAPYIRQCLDGFLMQQCDFEYEILIHDDASTDGTIGIIEMYREKYPQLIKPIIQKENQYSKGVRGFNFLFNFPRAKGEFLAICEGDDFWTDPCKLQKQVDLLERRPDLSFCSHNVNKVDQDGMEIKSGVAQSTVFFNEKEVFHKLFPTLSLLFRNVKLGYNDSLSKTINGDAVLIALLSSYGGAAHMGFVAASYRVHGGGIYSSSGHFDNSVKSINTRLLLINSGNLERWQITELKKEIKRRLFSLFKFSVKHFNIKHFFILSKLAWGIYKEK